MPQAAGQVNILIFLVKIKFFPCMPINFVMQGKCLFSDISRPVEVMVKVYLITQSLLAINYEPDHKKWSLNAQQALAVITPVNFHRNQPTSIRQVVHTNLYIENFNKSRAITL